jgi:dTDP-4-amino-4,6-dideoxygalactose transaminase
MKTDAFKVVRDFETALCEYTGAPYAVAVNSCTMAILLAVAWFLENGQQVPAMRRSTLSQARAWGALYSERVEIEIPKRTYVSVPMSIIHAGGRPTFRDEDWTGAYRLEPLPVWDSARRLRKGMYNWSTRWSDKNENAPSLHDEMVCLSFHWSKILGIEQGGAILHSDPEADAWLRMARFDGRQEGISPAQQAEHYGGFPMVGWHCYMSPEVAAAGLVRMQFLPDDNPDLPNDDYPDLSIMECFR